jgi:hypothetical protein
MTYEELVDFLERKMSMSHVYQPLLVRALVDAGGVATVRQLAQVFLAQDESQLLYYEKRIKETPRGNRLGRATGVSQCEKPDAPTEGTHSHDLRAEAPVVRTKAWDWDLGLPIVGRGADSR